MQDSRNIEKIFYRKKYWEAPVLASRICGEYSTVHNITAVKAIENACSISPSPQTIRLRELLLAGQMVKSHTIFLFQKILPDFIGLNSVIEIKKDHPNIYGNIIDLISYSNSILESVTGRIIHPIANVPGGFKSFPETNKLEEIINLSDSALQASEETIKLFSSFEYPSISRDIHFGALHQKDRYAIYDGEIWTTHGSNFAESNVFDRFLTELKPGQEIKNINLEGKAVMTGPLARIAQSMIPLKTVNIGIDLTFKNPLENILAAAIEANYFIQQSKEILENLLVNKIAHEPLKLPKNFGTGTAVCETPAGLLLHRFKLDKEGVIEQANFISPDEQNSEFLSQDISSLKESTADQNKDEQKKISRLLTKSYNLCSLCGSR